MHLIDAVKKSGKPYKILNCPRDELPEFFKELGFAKGAEIGVHRGEFSEKFCQAGLTMFAIDNWATRAGIYEKAMKRLSRYPNCTIIKKGSMEAVNEFPPGSLDFVYIDADHRFPYVAEDLYHWSERVKQDGIISGHDYMDTRDHPDDTIRGVGPVVDAFVKTFRIKNYYIFGHAGTVDQEPSNNKTLSFMFFKHW